jgi:hypothetical protein
MESVGAAHVVGLSQNGDVTLTAPDERELVAVETATGRQIGRIRNSREFSCLALTRDGHMVATGDYEHDVKLWDLSQSILDRRIEQELRTRLEKLVDVKNIVGSQEHPQSPLPLGPHELDHVRRHDVGRHTRHYRI